MRKRLFAALMIPIGENIGQLEKNAVLAEVAVEKQLCGFAVHEITPLVKIGIPDLPRFPYQTPETLANQGARGVAAKDDPKS